MQHPQPVYISTTFAGYCDQLVDIILLRTESHEVCLLFCIDVTNYLMFKNRPNNSFSEQNHHHFELLLISV